MAGKTVEIRKTVYNREQASKIVDTSFTTFAQTEEVEAPLTVAEFFQAYEDLYLDIPLTGDSNSHEYLLNRSGDLVQFDQQTQDIQPLLDEIAELRNINLGLNQEIIDLNIELAGGGS